MYHTIAITQFSKMLKNLSLFLEKAETFSETKKITADVLPNARLAPDQFSLVRQIQIACDTAKLGAAELCVKTAPSHVDNEQTLAECRARIQSTLDYLATFAVSDFNQAAQIHVTRTRWDGQYLTGHDFFLHHLIPNFYFHVTTAYAILRHNGVDLGKKDYLGVMPFKK